MNSIAIYSPIVKQIVVRIIERTELEKLKASQKNTLNADLVPNISDKMRPEELQESIHSPKEEQPITKSPQFSVLQVPQKPLAPVQPAHVPSQFQRQNPVDEREYGKLTPFLNDMAVNYVECFGADVPINVVKRGKPQTTAVSMTAEEIKAFLNVLSQKSRIPVQEGAFRVIVDDFIINSIVSDVLGTKFIIKKNFQIPQDSPQQPIQQNNPRRFY